MPLAGPVRARLAAWLDYRAKKGPRTLNTHLFVTQQTAPRLGAPGATFPWSKAGINPQSLRANWRRRPPPRLRPVRHWH